MFRKMLLYTLAAGALLVGVVAPTQAYSDYHPHPSNAVHVWHHREFCSMGEARAWVRHHHGCEVRFEWHGPHVWVFYR